MKLKVLGSGSSGNCYLLQSKGETLIIECGLPYKTILKGLKFNLNNVVGCLVSHEHKDHSKATQGLIKNGVDICSSKGTLDILNIDGYRTKIIESERLFKIGKFDILPFSTEHDATEPLGFLIQREDMGKLLFITDSYYCKYKFNGLNHIMIECNYSKEILEKNISDEGLNPALARRLMKSHFSLNNVKNFLESNDLRQVRDITLLHLSDVNSNATQFKEEIEKATGKPTYVADAGLNLEL